MKIQFQNKPAWIGYRSFALITTLAISGCATYPDWLASSGPSAEKVSNAQVSPDTSAIQVVDLTADVTRRLLSNQTHTQFSDIFADVGPASYVIGAGDVVQVSLWEAPPAMLFGSSMQPANAMQGGGASTSNVTTFPEQMVNSNGEINVPFAGQVQVAGHSPLQIEADIVYRLKDKANQPQVLIRVIKNATANVTVVGEVAASTRMPLTARGERLLDALAAGGGIRQSVPVNKATLQLTRGNQVGAMPLDSVIRDPKQNIILQPGDVLTALYQPLSFVALGATNTNGSISSMNNITGTNQEIYYEAMGISLAQALGRVGGLNDVRADAQGIFLFRFEAADALDWVKPPATTPEGKVPVVYKVDLKDPATFLFAQSFPIQNKDVLYIANAPSAELQKFLNLILTATYPFLNLFNSGIIKP